MIELNFFKKLLSQPSAPYRESHVKRLVQAFCVEKDIAHFEDPVGNLVLGVGSKEEYLKLLWAKHPEPVRVFIAHMDHPGFHGIELKKQILSAKWFGGGPNKHLVGAKVWLGDDARGFIGDGIVKSAKLNLTKTGISELKIQVKKGVEINDAKAIYGGFGFKAPMWKVGSRIYTKAADDLVGSAVIAQLAATQKGKPFIGLLTRAEEVGFIGALGHFDLGWIKSGERKVIAVSLETSRTLPGALFGKGPVVRLGDRASIFDPAATEILSRVAVQLLPGRHQRRIMDGGTCEATVAVVFGVPAMAISVPLGNYHNQSFEGGPGSRGKLGPAPEFVDFQDVQGMFKLCTGVMEPGLAWDNPFAPRRERFAKLLADAQTLLKS